MSECTLTNTFGQIIQVLLAFMVLIVLSTEYVVDVVRAWCEDKSRKRDVVQFWFDVFKISCGAAVSHLYNVLISMYLSGRGSGGDECALYAIAFVYEGSGVPFVQLLTYCVIKYAETMEAQSTFWRAVSHPGQYNHDADKIIGELDFNNRSFQKNLIISLIPSALCLLLGIELNWSNVVTYVGPIFGFMFFFTCFYTTRDARYQVLTWCGIKIFEKGIWTAFVVAQASYFDNWSKEMELSDSHLEAIYYVCLIPIAMNAFMFFMFSRISRLQLPCIRVKSHSRASIGSKSFDINEGLKVGVIFCILMNTVLWLACSLAFRDPEVVVVLLISMIILPLMMCSILLVVGSFIVNWRYSSALGSADAVPLISDSDIHPTQVPNSS